MRSTFAFDPGIHFKSSTIIFKLGKLPSVVLKIYAHFSSSIFIDLIFSFFCKIFLSIVNSSNNPASFKGWFGILYIVIKSSVLSDKLMHEVANDIIYTTA